MDRHTPLHPLPEEIQKMSRDQTVCKYCGVSYLILHEFTVLEEKVKALEEKVKFYEGSIEREKALQEKLQHLSRELEQCTAASESKTESAMMSLTRKLYLCLICPQIKTLSLETESKQAAIQNLKEQLKCLQKEKEISHKQSQLLQKRLEQHSFFLKKVFDILRFVRKEQNGIKERIFGFFKQWIALKGDICSQLENINISGLAELNSMNQSLGECRQQNMVLQEEVQRLRLMSDAAELEAQKLESSLLRERDLQNRFHELQKKTKDLTSQVETVELKFQKSAAEMSHYKELSMKKTKEVENHQSELQKLSSEIGKAESRFNHALTEREQSLHACQQVCRRLQEEVIEKERKEEDLKKQAQYLESELETIKSLLKQREEEVVMLKQERESVLISHQSRLEQLQETLRQKVLNEKSWQEKIPLLISSATHSLKTEIEALEEKLQVAQTKLTEKNEKREQKWQSVKNQVAELEIQLKEEQNTHHSITEEMRQEIKKKSYELDRLTDEQTQLIQNLNQVQEENALLQDTVRRECEERYELTEALAQAREQVVELKKLSGNFPLSHCSLSQGSLTSSTPSVSNHGQKSPSCGKGITHSGLCRISRATKAPICSKFKSSMDTSLPALPALQSPGGRVASLDESRRKRITAVIKRQLSEL
uniref:Protein LEKR1 isoform X4 n=1 Tax=Pogona vitticeps TaxID=103695 RepID=A0ABM5G3I1_9SAUR